MRFLPTIIHGVIDYLFGIIMFLLPWFVQLGPGENTIFYAVGILAFIYSLITKYELGLVHLISMRTHLFIDLLLGIGLIAAPMVLHSEFTVPIYFLIPGLFAITASMITKREPDSDRL